jgi:hypothetical protein
MKKLFLFLIQLFLCYSLQAQYSSIHGESLPASGTLRALVVYAQMDCSQCPTLCHPDNSNWLPDSLPPNPESWFDTYYTGGTYQTKDLYLIFIKYLVISKIIFYTFIS